MGPAGDEIQLKFRLEFGDQQEKNGATKQNIGGPFPVPAV